VKLPEVTEPPLESFRRPALDTAEQRRALFSILSHVLIRAKEEFDNTGNEVSQLKWGRLICSASLAYGKLLEGVELSEILDELENYEKISER
jgi:hypothetical protein